VNAPSSTRAVPLPELFWGFFQIGIFGFGGVGPIARHIIVEQRNWLTEREYATVLGMGKILPGANTINAGVMIGDRFRGRLGAVVCVAALMAAPLAILVMLALLYDRYSGNPAVDVAMGGAAAAAAGTVIGAGLKMACNLRPGLLGWLIGALAVIAVAVLGLSLIQVVLVLAPLAVVATAWKERRR